MHYIFIENKDRRMRMQSQSLIRQPPSEQERLVIHEQFLRTVIFLMLDFCLIHYLTPFIFSSGRLEKSLLQKSNKARQFRLDGGRQIEEYDNLSSRGM